MKIKVIIKRKVWWIKEVNIRYKYQIEDQQLHIWDKGLKEQVLLLILNLFHKMLFL